MANQNYKILSRPYDNFLERETAVPQTGQEGRPQANGTEKVDGGANAGSSEKNGYVEPKNIRNDGSFSDVWIRTFIRSENWSPRKRGFYIDGRTGYAEFTNVFLSGNITATTGSIGGFTIASDNLYATDGANTTKLSSGEIALSAGVTASPSIKIYRTGQIYVGSSNPIIIDGVNREIESENYVSGAFGRGFHLDSNLFEVGNIACRGIFRTSVFQKDIINVIAGSFVVSPNGDVLDSDMSSGDDATLTIKGTVTLAVNDILRLKEMDGVTLNDEWMRVTDITNAPTYTVTRDLAGNYPANGNPEWKKGAAVVDYGQSGQGGVYLTASDVNAPYVSVFTHTGSPWTDIDTKMRMGNLNGFLGYATDEYGIAIGDASRYLKYDSSNGLRIQGTITITNPSDISTSTLNNDAGWTGDQALTDFIAGTYADDMTSLQNQLDGVVVNWFLEGVPTELNSPAVDWTTDELKAEHEGDLYFDLLTGYSYRWIVEAGVYSWYQLPDSDVTAALAAAAAAQDTADSKRRVFTAEPFTPYDVGDLWLTSLLDFSGDIKKCITAKVSGAYDASHWVVAAKYTDDTTANLAQARLDDIADDEKITPVEKLEAKRTWDAVVVEGTPTTGTIPVQAIALSVSTTNFDTKYAALNTYLNTTLSVFSDMTSTTTIVRSAWNTAWNDYFNERTLILNAISAKAATISTWSGVSGTGKPEDNATLGANWNSNLTNIPTTLAAPSGSGLFLSATNMGYYTGGAWKTYIDNSGNMILGNYAGGGAGLAWSQAGATLSVRGAIYATSGTFSGSLSAATGTFAGSLSAATGTFSGSLSAASGTFTGSLSAASGTIGTITIGSGGAIKYGKTAYTDDTNPGFWLGDVAGVAKLNIGSSASKYLHYDGSNFVLNGGYIYGNHIYATSTSAASNVHLRSDGPYGGQCDIEYGGVQKAFYAANSTTSILGSKVRWNIQADDNIFMSANGWVQIWYNYNGGGDTFQIVQSEQGYIALQIDSDDASEDAYFAGNVSANSFTDRTPYYTGNAISELKMIKSKKNEKNEDVIDHDSLPSFMASSYILPRQKIRKPDGTTDDGPMPPRQRAKGRDLGAAVSMLIKAVAELDEKIDLINKKH